jgi:integrase
VGRNAAALNALAVSRIAHPGMHAVGTVAGLYLQVLQSGARSWILRAVIGGKRRDMGLGGYPAVTLAQARQKARMARDKIADGVDPIEERRASRTLLKAAQASARTFKQCAAAYMDAHCRAWRNPKHIDQWRSTLHRYAYPVIGELRVRDVELPHVLRILEPIWHEKTETASRLRGRIERVLHWAIARGYRTAPNPARWRGHLDTMLAAPGRLVRDQHQPALPVSELGAFMAELRRREGMAARALEFAILCAARSGEVRGALWSEIDLRSKVWTVPAARIKARKEHRVPLSERAVEVLRSLPRGDGTDLVFPAPRGGTLSDMTLTAVIRRMNEQSDEPRWIDPKSDKQAVPHGFRSTFRDWAAERTDHPRELADMALAHTIEGKVEAAYRRGDLFAKRRRMMDDWARFCARVERKGTVLAFNKSAA